MGPRLHPLYGIGGIGGSNDKGIMGAGSSDWTNTEADAANWEEARKAIPLTGLN